MSSTKYTVDTNCALLYVWSMEDRKTERVHVPMTKAELKAVEDWRYANRIPSRAEAIRELIRRGLNHEGN